jgi:hypothetical protein
VRYRVAVAGAPPCGGVVVVEFFGIRRTHADLRTVAYHGIEVRRCVVWVPRVDRFRGRCLWWSGRARFTYMLYSFFF